MYKKYLSYIWVYNDESKNLAFSWQRLHNEALQKPPRE